MSEILDPTGHALLHHMTKCHRPPWFNPETYTVIQTRPTSRLRIKQWQLFCQHLLTLPSPGPWVPNRILRLRRETYLLPPPQHTIYHWHLGSYWECRLLDATHSVFELHCPTTWTPSTTAHPIHCSARIRNRLYLQLPARPPHPLPHVSIPQHFQEYIQQLPRWECRTSNGKSIHFRLWSCFTHWPPTTNFLWCRTALRLNRYQ